MMSFSNNNLATTDEKMKTMQQQSHSMALTMALTMTTAAGPPPPPPEGMLSSSSSSPVVSSAESLSSWSQTRNNNINNHNHNNNITDVDSSSSNGSSSSNNNDVCEEEETRNFNNHENIKNNFRTRIILPNINNNNNKSEAVQLQAQAQVQARVVKPRVVKQHQQQQRGLPAQLFYNGGSSSGKFNDAEEDDNATTTTTAAAAAAMLMLLDSNSNSNNNNEDGYKADVDNYASPSLAASSSSPSPSISRKEMEMEMEEQIVTPLIADFMKNDKNHIRRVKQLELEQQHQEQAGGVVTLHPHDVVVDWGSNSNSRNEFYRALIMKNRSSTSSSGSSGSSGSSDMKAWIGGVIVKAVQQRGLPYGRFLKKSSSSSSSTSNSNSNSNQQQSWTVVSTEEAVDAMNKMLLQNNAVLHDNDNDNDNDQQEVPPQQTTRCNNNSNKRIIVRDDDHDGSGDNITSHSPLKKRCLRRQQLLPTKTPKTKTKTKKYSPPPQETIDIVIGTNQKQQQAKKKTTKTQFVSVVASVSNTYPQEMINIFNNQHQHHQQITNVVHSRAIENNNNISISRGIKEEGCSSKTTIGSMNVKPKQESTSIEQHNDKQKQKKQVIRKGKTYYTFHERLIQLADYKKKNGDCNVPKLYKGHDNLGHFVGDQRYQYKRYNENKKSPMTTDRIVALENLDFEWTLVMSFDERLIQLASYKENNSKNNDCNVPFRYKGYKNLGRWVREQRQHYKNYKENKPRSITLSQIMALEKLNFEWRLERTPEQQQQQQQQRPPVQVMSMTMSSMSSSSSLALQQKKENNNGDNNNETVQAVAAEEGNDRGNNDDGGAGWRDGCGEYYDSDDDCWVF